MRWHLIMVSPRREICIAFCTYMDAVGSLAARIVFQPIEETSRVFFSKTLSSSSKTSMDSLRTASDTLFTLLLLFTHLLLLLVTFAPPYLDLALSLALPGRYLHTSAPSILRVYVYYIPTMAFNGVLEAFFASTASTADLRAQSRWLLIFSLAFVGGAVFCAKSLGLGDAGLVWANVANLWLRASYAWLFARQYFAGKGAAEMIRVRRAIPPHAVLGAFATSAVITRWTRAAFEHHPSTLRGQIGHVGIGGVCVVACLLAW